MWAGAKSRLLTTFSFGEWLPMIDRLSGTDCAAALTYDDGPSPHTTSAILELLRAYGARATFFLCGARAAAHPDLVGAVIAEGHAAYAHGFSHSRLDLLDEDEAIEELARTEHILSRFRPTPSPYLVRLPYGSGHRSVRIHRLLRRWRPDCQFAHWRYNFEDFRLAEQCRTLDQLNRRCAVAVDEATRHRKLRGSVVLLHEDPFDAKGALVPRIAESLLRPLLSAMKRDGVAAVPLRPLDRAPLFQRYVRTVSVQ